MYTPSNNYNLTNTTHNKKLRSLTNVEQDVFLTILSWKSKDEENLYLIGNEDLIICLNVK
jgi:hypothetical protein